MSRHAQYEKYYYSELIRILRVRCEVCGTTHAVIPSFSLPGTSVGTDDVEQYLIARHKGISRSQCPQEKLQSQMRYDRYTTRLDNRLNSYVNRAKALFPTIGDHQLTGLDWIYSIIQTHDRPLYEFNQFCLINNINAIFFARFNILIFKKNKPGPLFSHKKGTGKMSNSHINSS